MRRSWFLGFLVCAVPLAGCGAGSGGRPEDAATVSALDQEGPGAAFERGQAAAAHGDGVRAEQYFLLAMQRGYEQRRVLPVLLAVCIANQHLRTALEHAEPYLLEHPDDDGLRFLVATIHAGLGRSYDARAELERLLRHTPDDADAHFLLGVLLEDDSPVRAREHFVRYVELAPDGRHAAEAESRASELSFAGESAARPVARRAPNPRRRP